MYFESWFKGWCPSCNAINWHLDGGDTLDAEAIQCHKCSCVFEFNRNPEKSPETCVLNPENGLYLKDNVPVYIVQGRENV